MWCNLGFAGAWQIALGFAVLWPAGALYHTLVRRNALLAGIWFTVAVGNRTELVLTLPAFLFRREIPSNPAEIRKGRAAKTFALFFTFPAALLLSTAMYNWARFGSITDFGYAHIPGVLNEPCTQHGIFSLNSIRWNAYEMLFRGLSYLPTFPYLKPYGFGCSIFLASPFLFLLFREGGQRRWELYNWILIIGVLTFTLWGTWALLVAGTFYRYGVILLPWMFVSLLKNGLIWHFPPLKCRSSLSLPRSTRSPPTNFFGPQ